MNTWRLIISSPAPGAWNMAVDEALLENAYKNPDIPTLRLYSWNPYAVSLGHAQPYSDISPNDIHSFGWDIVRRPTGGRAILHADELTYSLVFNENNPQLKGGVLESYRKISEALIAGLQMLGINAQSKIKSATSTQTNKDAVCFQNPSDYELIFNGKKIIGSAQARRNGYVLQHGAIPLFGDISRIINVLHYSDPKKRADLKEKLLGRATTLSDAADKKILWNDASISFIRGFSKTFDLSFSQKELASEEIETANKLYNEKHTTAEWIKRV